MKGQVVIEYLILVAVVLLVAIMTIALFGMFPDFARGIQTKHSQDFWKNQAMPFSVSEAYFDSSTARAYLVIKSHSDEELKIKKLYLNNTQLSIFNFSEPDLEGVGASYCDSYACSGGCNCQLNISPFGETALTTESFASEEEICGQKIKNAILNFELIYSERADLVNNYVQTGAFPLVIECKSSFNN